MKKVNSGMKKVNICYTKYLATSMPDRLRSVESLFLSTFIDTYAKMKPVDGCGLE